MSASTQPEYRDFIKSKEWKCAPCGFEPTIMPDSLFPYQRDCVRWACRKGRAALFEDCGLGKSFQQIVWAANVAAHTSGSVLILAPLAVAEQTRQEAERWGFVVHYVKEPEEITCAGIYVTNYDRAERFLEKTWHGIVLDESSILKSHTGSTRNLIIEHAARIPFRLACTATPSPNDHTELGNHAEFLGVMTRTEMLASFFVHDGGETSVWRLKGHAQKDFWKWVAGWAIMMRKPSDIGHSDEGFTLPDLSIIPHYLDSGIVNDGYIFAVAAKTLNDQREVKRKTLSQRVRYAAALVAQQPDEQWLIWCDLNDEGDALEQSIPGSLQVAGSNTDQEKTERMLGFASGSVPILISKSKICGFGMNFQKCARMIFIGPSHSYESFYQAVRRCHRFGQKRSVEVHVISTDVESDILANQQRKQREADQMAQGMVDNMGDITRAELEGTERQSDTYRTGKASTSRFDAHLGDCVEGVSALADESVGYTIFSPPFASLYTYSNSPFDMGNVRDDAEFFGQFKYLIKQLFRVTMAGRLVSFHCMNMPTSKERDGFIGIRDFRGELIRAFVEAGWIFHSEVCIWKDPVTAMQRTKALGLLHKTIRKDSSMSRQGIPDYLVTMRKPGVNPERIKHGDDLKVDLWQQYASPVWMDINPSNTLQKTSAREENDERHICPLQLEVIQRAMHLWSNPGDLVLSPFMGIGSEGVVALRMCRRFVGFELKPSYYTQAVANLKSAEMETDGQQTIFGVAS